jgi:hypothetical protein
MHCNFLPLQDMQTSEDNYTDVPDGMRTGRIVLRYRSHWNCLVPDISQ